jgi:hypothetical protein
MPRAYNLLLLFFCDVGSSHLLHKRLQPTVATMNPFLWPNSPNSSLNSLTLEYIFPGGNNSAASFRLASDRFLVEKHLLKDPLEEGLG